MLIKKFFVPSGTRSSHFWSLIINSRILVPDNTSLFKNGIVVTWTDLVEYRCFVSSSFEKIISNFGTMVNYLDKVSDLTSRNDAFYVVDSVSLLGGAELPVDKWNIDVCLTGAQKALAAPPGISPISVSPKAKKYMIENPPSTMYFNLARYFKYYEESKHTPFTPALPLLYAYREAITMMLEEGLQNVYKRHKVCSDALYSGLSAIGLTPYVEKEEDRSISIVALNYLDGLEDKTFRNTLANKFKVLVAGGFGDLKGKVFRVGCMGEVSPYHVMRTISAISSTLAMMGYETDAKAGLETAEEKLKVL